MAPVAGLITIGSPMPTLSNVEPSTGPKGVHAVVLANGAAGAVLAPLPHATINTPVRQMRTGRLVGVNRVRSFPMHQRCTACVAIRKVGDQPPMVWISCTPILIGVVVRRSASVPVAPLVACHDTFHTIVTEPW